MCMLENSSMREAITDDDDDTMLRTVIEVYMVEKTDCNETQFVFQQMAVILLK